jgi:hypothetical protein
MKTNWLIILLVIVSASTINLGSTLKSGTPSIEFVGHEEFSGKNGDVFIYSIKLRSNENLVNFNVVPSIAGENSDCKINYFFDKNTNQAYVNYLYVLPKNVKDVEQVILTFTLSDSKESNMCKQVIRINDINFADAKDELTVNKEI